MQKVEDISFLDIGADEGGWGAKKKSRWKYVSLFTYYFFSFSVYSAIHLILGMQSKGCKKGEMKPPLS